MDLKKQRQLVDAVLSDWPVARRKHVVLHFEGRAVTASVVSESGELVVGEAKCHPVDKFDDFSGAIFALARLRVRYAYRQMMRKFKTWIPEYGQLYFVPSVHGKSPAVASMASARSIVWKSSPIDLMYLAMGLVFRSPKDAMKKARTLLFDGHNIRNIVNRLTPPDDVLRQSAELPADLLLLMMFFVSLQNCLLICLRMLRILKIRLIPSLRLNQLLISVNVRKNRRRKKSV